MAKFNEMRLTTRGKSIYAKAIAGKTITFNKALLGDGGARASDTTEEMISPIFTAAVSVDSTSQEGVAVVTISVDNSSLNDALEVSEVGLFCKDPDTDDEVLYGYAYALEQSDVIPSVNDGEVTWKMKLLVYIENASIEETEQSDKVTLTPTVTATGASNIVAKCEYMQKGSIIFAFFKVTGTLSSATSVQVSIPKTATFDTAVCGRVNVGGNISPISGIISQNTDVALFSNINAGNFTLVFSAQYLI